MENSNLYNSIHDNLWSQCLCFCAVCLALKPLVLNFTTHRGFYLIYKSARQVLNVAPQFRTSKSLVLPPDALFHTPCALAKNRVWTLSPGKLGQVDVWWSVIVAVNYMYIYQLPVGVALVQKICKLAICDDVKRNLLYLSDLIGVTTC